FLEKSEVKHILNKAIGYAKWLVKKKIFLWVMGILFSTGGIILIGTIGLLVILIGLISIFSAEEGKNEEEQLTSTYELAEVPEGVLKYEDDIESELQAQGLDESFLPNRKSTRLNSSHVSISYAVFCLKK